MKAASRTPIKKPYHPPKLTVYGDLTQMTLSAGMFRMMVDATGMHKTH